MIDAAVLKEAFERLGTAYAVAKELNVDHSSVARRIRKLGLRSEPITTPRRHIVIPDGQVKPGVPVDHWDWIGRYIVDMGPDVVVNIGDFADMESLSSYDKGKRSFEGRRYKKDVAASKQAMELLMNPLAGMTRSPVLHLTLGNHEYRINRAVENEAILEDVISVDDLEYAKFGWNTHDFLVPVEVDGIFYAHYFTSGVMGRPASSARVLAKGKHQSCVMGHVQHVDMHPEYRANGTRFWGLFSGTCYQHNEPYLGPQGNAQWRGIWVLNEVDQGDFQPMMVSLDYLKRTYATRRAA